MLVKNAKHKHTKRKSVVVPSNPLKADPTRTATLRRRFVTDMRVRYRMLKGRIIELLITDDAFGLKRGFNNPFANNVVNTHFSFQTDAQKLASFTQWLETQVETVVMAGATRQAIEDAWWAKYVQQGYEKGAGRAFDDVKKPALASGKEQLAFFDGTKREFLQQSFGRPESIEKVKLLASRVFTDLKGVNDVMASQMTRALADGLSQGQNPHTIAKALNERVDAIGQVRSTTIARTEIIRAHAEGQLDALERMGVVEVGVMVEWSTAGDDRVCTRCQPMEGSVLKIKEARGLIPLHPNCRCAFIPANIGEDPKQPLRYSPEGQKRSKTEIDDAIRKSIKATKPKKSKRTIAEQKALTPFRGKTIAKRRPRGVLEPERQLIGPQGKSAPKIPKPKPVAPIQPVVPAIKVGRSTTIKEARKEAKELGAIRPITNTKEAAKAVTKDMDRKIKRGDFKNPPPLDEIEENWKAQFRRRDTWNKKAAFTDIDEHAELRLQNAINYNQDNAKYVKFKDEFGEEVIILRNSEGWSGRAEYRGTIHYYQDKFNIGPDDIRFGEKMAFIEKEIGPRTRKGKEAVWHMTDEGGVAGTLRHEYGHQIHERMGDAKRSEWNKKFFMGTSKQDIESGLSSYAATNENEMLAEVFSLITHPNYKRENYPEWIGKAEDWLEGLLK